MSSLKLILQVHLYTWRIIFQIHMLICKYAIRNKNIPNQCLWFLITKRSSHILSKVHDWVDVVSLFSFSKMLKMIVHMYFIFGAQIRIILKNIYTIEIWMNALQLTDENWFAYPVVRPVPRELTSYAYLLPISQCATDKYQVRYLVTITYWQLWKITTGNVNKNVPWMRSSSYYLWKFYYSK